MRPGTQGDPFAGLVTARVIRGGNAACFWRLLLQTPGYLTVPSTVGTINVLSVRWRQQIADEERMMGLEPTTFCMASRRSSQLSYIRVAASVPQASASRASLTRRSASSLWARRTAV